MTDIPLRDQLGDAVAASLLGWDELRINRVSADYAASFVVDALLERFDMQLRSPHPTPEPGDEEETRYVESLSNYDEIVERAHPTPDANEEGDQPRS